ncbi:MAG: threonylcarbamoyl-AMP synthase [Synergistaceae bacterium]|nr:threonylcarbamoyl-AMP synthase [Synergistaceae bacterium]
MATKNKLITKFAAIDLESPDPIPLNKAARIIRSGGLVAFPTETVYGLGADALNPDAVKRIYEAKGRPSDNPLILHVDSTVQAENLVYVNDAAKQLMRRFWPGPLTLVLPARPCVPEITRGGLETAAVRMPRNFIARYLIWTAETPIAAPSANLSGRPSPTDAVSVYYDMNGKIDMIIDGGRVNVGIESTVIDVSNPEHVLLLRPGGTGREEIEEVLNMRLELPDAQSAKRSPGTRYRHYAPAIPVKIWHRESEFPESDYSSAGYMGLHEPPNETGKALIFADYEEYARELFASFRRLEREGYTCIIAEWPEEESGICEGLRDRILRAAMD